MAMGTGEMRMDRRTVPVHFVASFPDLCILFYGAMGRVLGGESMGLYQGPSVRS